jgi:carboxylesterase
MIRLSGLGAISSKEIRTGILSDKAYEVSPVHGLEGVIYGRSIHSQRLGLRRLRRKIRGVVCPVMALHAKGDTTVGVENVSRIASKVSSDFVVKKIYDIPEDVWSRKHRIAAHTMLKDDIYEDIILFLTQGGPDRG